MDIWSCLFIFGSILGHGATHVYLYNRINALGLRRVTLKRFEKVVLAHFFIVPAILLAYNASTIAAMFNSRDQFDELTAYAKVYSSVMVIVLLLLLPNWIVGRIEYWKQRKHATRIQAKTVNVADKMDRDLFKPRWLKQLAKFPGNQIALIEIATKHLVIPTLPPVWDGLRIAHLSDLHLIGWYDNEYLRTALKEISALTPDLLVVSGDIVDKTQVLEQLPELFQPFSYPLGQYFILGNHDTRIPDINEIRVTLNQIGWTDLGTKCYEHFCSHRNATLQLLGNERPWIDVPDRNISERELLQRSRPKDALRIGVAHNPDQWHWSIEAECHVTLCGHTHGGQVRIPIIGPVISPSWNGSRYASGIFVRSGNTMHVSRGLAGTQPLRINCLPEASLLVLTAK